MVSRNAKRSSGNELDISQSPQHDDVEDVQKPDGHHDAVFGEIAKEGGPNYRNVGYVC